jgi:hypothetical protein
VRLQLGARALRARGAQRLREVTEGTVGHGGVT